MLNSDALAQLQGLKSELEAQKEYTEATVKGTQNRYGFAVVDDGREIFIPPDEMLKVLPGDRVRICIRPAGPAKGKPAKAKGRDNRTVADIEALIECPLDRFVGKVVTKGKALFVIPDVPQLSRWLFIPSEAREGAEPGEYVACQLLRHPIRDGKPSARILQRFGTAADPGVENRYCAARAGIHWSWPAEDAERLLAFARTAADSDGTPRTDLTHLPFISIDAARTQDIDDALYAEVTATGWELYVAVADPTSVLGGLDDIGALLARRGTSVYFHGDMVPMLPEAISRDFCALAEEQTRPALVCRIAVSDAGEVGSFDFMNARVRSRAKLSYAAVDRYVTGHNDELIAHSTPLEALVQAYRALRSHREASELVMEDRVEYRWQLNDARQIESVESFEKLASQRLVEECMIAANKCAAAFLTSGGASGPFVVHRGFRGDRLKEGNEFLKRHKPELADIAIDTLEGYRTVLAGLAAADSPLPLRGMVNRLLSRAELSTKSGEHKGLALPCYTNFTSPLRKAVDFFVHLQIKALLAETPANHATGPLLQEITRALARSRAATAAAERWLTANYLNRLAAAGTRRYTGVICHVASSGFNVRLDDTGLEGQVDLRADAEKFSFDKWTASLTSTTRRFQLEQRVEVDLVDAVADNDHVARFALVPGCGLKPAKPDAERRAEPDTTNPEQNP